MLIRGSVQQEDTCIKHVSCQRSKIHEANIRRIEERSSSIKLEGDFNTLLSIINGTAKQHINKEIEALNIITTQMNPTDIHLLYHPATVDAQFCQVQMEHSPGYFKKLKRNFKRMKSYKVSFMITRKSTAEGKLENS